METDTLFALAGKYRGCSKLLQNHNLKPHLDQILDYSQARKLPDFEAQMYNLELCFPGEIAFLGGLRTGDSLELIQDLQRKEAISTYATVEFLEQTIKIQNSNCNVSKESIYHSCFGDDVSRKIMIGYLLLDKLLPQSLLAKQGFNGYMNSVMVEPDFRGLKGIGKRMVERAEEILGPGKQILTTWVDTGKPLDNVPRLNTAHYPGATFWEHMQYQPIRSLAQAYEICPALQEFQESHGVTGRKYIPELVKGAEIKRYTGQQIISDKWDQIPFAILPEFYENKWTGIIMIKEEKKK